MDVLAQTGKGCPTKTSLCPNRFLFTESHPGDTFNPTPESLDPMCTEHLQPVPEYHGPKMLPQQLDQLSTQLQFYWNTFGLSVPEYPFIHPVFLPQQLRQLSHQIQQYRTIFPMQQSHYNEYYPQHESLHLQSNHSNVNNWETVEQHAQGTHSPPHNAPPTTFGEPTSYLDPFTSHMAQPHNFKCVQLNQMDTPMSSTSVDITQSTLENEATEFDNATNYSDYQSPATIKTPTPVGPLKCAYCPKTFKLLTTLYGHCVIYHPTVPNPTTTDGQLIPVDRVRIYDCDQCPKKFHRKFLLDQHKEVHLTETSVICGICNIERKTLSSLRKHMWYAHANGKVTNVKCDDCGTYFSSKRALTVHQRAHGGIAFKFICTICSKGCTTKHKLQTHMLQHTKDAPHLTSCASTSTHPFPTINANSSQAESNTSTEWNVHSISATHDSTDQEKQTPTNAQHLPDQSITTRTAPTPRQKYKCAYCLETFHSVRKLRSHCVFQHPDLPIPTTTDGLLITQEFKCLYCPQTVASPRRLAAHCAIQHPEIQNPTTIDGIKIYIDRFKVYECDQCNKKLDSRFALDRHKQSHMSSSIECGICKFSFKSQFRLRVHMTDVHPNGKVTDFKCQLCETYLDTQKALNQHQWSHVSPRKKTNMFQCNMCPKAYGSQHALKYHKLVHTGNPRPKCLICRKRYLTESALLKHLASVHQQQDPPLNL